MAKRLGCPTRGWGARGRLRPRSARTLLTPRGWSRGLPPRDGPPPPRAAFRESLPWPASTAPSRKRMRAPPPRNGSWPRPAACAHQRAWRLCPPPRGASASPSRRRQQPRREGPRAVAAIDASPPLWRRPLSGGKGGSRDRPPDRRRRRRPGAVGLLVLEGVSVRASDAALDAEVDGACGSLLSGTGRVAARVPGAADAARSTGPRIDPTKTRPSKRGSPPSGAQGGGAVPDQHPGGRAQPRLAPPAALPFGAVRPRPREAAGPAAKGGAGRGLRGHPQGPRRRGGSPGAGRRRGPVRQPHVRLGPDMTSLGDPQRPRRRVRAGGATPPPAGRRPRRHRGDADAATAAGA